VTTESSRAERLQLNTSRGQRRWTYDENIELMHCFYLAKRDGTGYRNRLKRLWDLRNPDKCVLSVNVLCCHARNIQTGHMLPDHELRRIENLCTHDSGSPENCELLSGPICQSIEESEPASMREPSTEPAIVFSGDTASLGILSDKFDKLTIEHNTENSSLPKLSSVSKRFNEVAVEVNECLKCLLEGCTPSLLQCVHLLYAAAATVADLLHQAPSRSRQSQGSWKYRLNRRIRTLRGDLSRLVAGGFPPSGSHRLLYLLSGLHCKYNISSVSSFQVATEKLKQKITSYASRLRRYQQRSQRYFQNRRFQRNEKRFYSQLLEDSDAKFTPPELNQLESFWKGIFQRRSVANLQATWVSELQAQLAAKHMEVCEPKIDMDMFILCLKRLRNWASPGPDGIQGFWIKKFPALYGALLHHYNVMLQNGTLIPEWFPRGRTLLIPKSSDTSIPKNFRPITCLNILYKLWTACLTELLTGHFQVNSLLHPAQKGCARGQLGCVDHLLLNNRIWHQVKSKNRSLSVSWLDYKKAYDSVPHNWIVWCLHLFRSTLH